MFISAVSFGCWCLPNFVLLVYSEIIWLPWFLFISWLLQCWILFEFDHFDYWHFHGSVHSKWFTLLCGWWVCLTWLDFRCIHYLLVVVSGCSLRSTVAWASLCVTAYLIALSTWVCFDFILELLHSCTFSYIPGSLILVSVCCTLLFWYCSLHSGHTVSFQLSLV
mgnify:CR=1 FL=1